MDTTEYLIKDIMFGKKSPYIDYEQFTHYDFLNSAGIFVK